MKNRNLKNSNEKQVILLKTKKIPMRKCVGCMESKPKKELLRIVWSQEGLLLDKTGKANGRGVYVCPNANCFAKANKKKAFARSLGTDISPEDMDNLSKEFDKYE